MTFLQQMIDALPLVATSWPALVGYVGLIVAFVAVSSKVTRNRNVLAKLESLPNKDRARALEMEMGAAYLASGLSPEQWLQQQRQRFYFLGFLALCVLVAGLVAAASLRGVKTPDPIEARRSAEKIASQFVDKLHSKDFSAAYDMFSSDVTRNISFSQFRSDVELELFQLPDQPEQSSLDQSIEGGGFLTVFLISRFGSEARIRSAVTFATGQNGWKLWRYDLQPVEWPFAWPTSTRVAKSPSELTGGYSNLDEGARSDPLPESLRGYITGGPPGWRVIVNSIDAVDGVRCTINGTAADSNVSIQLARVIGGCKVHEGQTIIVNAIVTGVSASKVQLDGVRYFPAS
jgi:hypothetical protein